MWSSLKPYGKDRPPTGFEEFSNTLHPLLPDGQYKISIAWTTISVVNKAVKFIQALILAHLTIMKGKCSSGMGLTLNLTEAPSPPTVVYTTQWRLSTTKATVGVHVTFVLRTLWAAQRRRRKKRTLANFTYEEQNVFNSMRR